MLYRGTVVLYINIILETPGSVLHGGEGFPRGAVPPQALSSLSYSPEYGLLHDISHATQQDLCANTRSMQSLFVVSCE